VTEAPRRFRCPPRKMLFARLGKGFFSSVDWHSSQVFNLNNCVDDTPTRTGFVNLAG